jgi:phenylacetic acid degradation operon negative regulatory protein
MDEELRTRPVGLPTARSLHLTVLGQYVLPGSGEVWQETLVASLASLGYSQQAAQQAVRHSAVEGWLETAADGRGSRVSLTGASRRLLASGAERIYSFAQPLQWDGRWLLAMLNLPGQRRMVRHQLRSRLAWAGFGSIGGGVWLTPHVEREIELTAAIRDEPDADACSFIAQLGQMGDLRALIAEAWDLNRVRDEYLAFIETFGGPRPASAEARFRMHTLLVHAWTRFPSLDPDLPSSLLPADWPRARARALFCDRHDRWASGARTYFEELEANFSLAA